MLFTGHTNYAVSACMGGLEGRRPSNKKYLWRLSATNMADSRQKDGSRGRLRLTAPHRVTCITLAASPRLADSPASATVAAAIGCARAP